MITKKYGFTLIEILVVITIFGIVLVVANQMLFSALKGASKSEVTAKVKRDGENVISTMERQLHNARSISCEATEKIVTYKNPLGTTTTFSCIDIGTNNGRVTSGSDTLTSSDVLVSSCSITCDPSNDPKAVLINMTLSEKTGSSLRVEERSSLNLRTRVLLRN
ncbi:MAG: type II secretion system protein [Candidatus Blackburnbacteria bacterium]|nr:type II secretion system protein [Candidatus Blackburnbacteria bacterium]